MKFKILLSISLFIVSFAKGVEFNSNDKIVLLGNTFIERDVNFGHIETLLSISLADKKVTFRNLGWSGDTVYGHARSYFGPPKEGFERLTNHIDFLKPTIVLICYGSVAAFEGKAGINGFEEGYEKLIDMIRSKAGSRIVLISPPPFENLGPPLPNMVLQNTNLSIYSQSIKGVAMRKKCDYVDLFNALGAGKVRMVPPVTINGIHFSSQGYKRVALALVEALDLGDTEKVTESDVERVRSFVIEKNRLFFNRWRPQNETYLHGFRKHEQGNNAKEIPMFDPLIEQKEKSIHDLANSFSREKK